MKAMKTVGSLVAIFVYTPIWYYLLHWMLVKAGAGDLQMFLFWVYVPVGLFVSTLMKIVELNK